LNIDVFIFKKMHKFLYIIILILLTNCQFKPVNYTHGVAFLEKKQTLFIVKKTNKNDVKEILGPPSTRATFEKDVWIYIERNISRGKLLRLGQNVLNKNNVLVLKFDYLGILEEKEFYDKSKINKIKFTKKETQAINKERNFIYNFLSSMRHKMQAPAKKRLKERR